MSEIFYFIRINLMKKFLSLFFAILLFVSFARAQTTEVTIQLNEQFFDALLDAVFKSSTPLEFPLAENNTKLKNQTANSFVSSFNEYSTEASSTKSAYARSVCSESIRLQREIDGVRTAVRFRDGKVFAPIAFSGNYNPPLIGCVEFSGWAETNIELEFDRERQALIGRARVLNVSLSGTRGIGGSLITRLVQSSIDKRINPIQIMQTDKVSFVVPVQNAGSLRMKAVGIRHEVANGILNVHIAYEFLRS
ncbi:MAG: hypothetical protein JWN60_1332 [Acidobacteria bacterium]|nr:hypothetical protein [Acidobacteriota bacterium]